MVGIESREKTAVHHICVAEEENGIWNMAYDAWDGSKNKLEIYAGWHRSKKSRCGMEHRLATWIASWIDRICPMERVERIKLEYGMEVLLDNLLKAIAFLVMAASLGTIKESLLVFIGFGALRLRAGGCHCDTNAGCWLLSGLIIVGGGCLAHASIMPFGATAFALSLSLWAVAKYAPSGTANNPILPKYHKKMKAGSIMLISFYLLVTVLDTRHGTGAMLAIGAVSEAASLLPCLNRKYCKKLQDA